MSRVVVHTVKSYGGEEFENTWGVIVNANDDTLPNEAAMKSIVGQELAITSLDSDPTDPGYSGGNYAVRAILGFERMLQHPDVRFERVYISDGKDNNINSVFLTIPLGFNGLWSAGVTMAGIAPGSITLYIQRRSNSLSQKPGRLNLRLALLDTEVRPLGKGLLAFTDAAAQGEVEARVAAAINDSSIDNHFQGGDDQTAINLGIPKYENVVADPLYGQLIGMAPLTGLVVVKPTSRQVSRGKRKPVAV